MDKFKDTFKNLSNWEPWVWSVVPLLTIGISTIIYNKMKGKPETAVDLSFLPEEYGRQGWYELNVGTHTYNIIFAIVYFITLYSILFYLSKSTSESKHKQIAMVTGIATVFLYIIFTIGVSIGIPLITAENPYMQGFLVYITSVVAISSGMVRLDMKKSTSFAPGEYQMQDCYADSQCPPGMQCVRLDDEPGYCA